MFNDQFTFYYVTDIIQFAETSVPSRPFLLRNANGFLPIDVDVMSILIRVNKMCVIFENKLAQSYRRKFPCLKREASVPAFFYFERSSQLTISESECRKHSFHHAR